MVGLWVRSCWIVDALDSNIITWNSAAKLRGSGIGLASWNGHAELTLDYDDIGSTRFFSVGDPTGKERLHVNVTHWPLRKYSWLQSSPTWSWCGFYRAKDMMFVAPFMDFNEPHFVTDHYGAPDWVIVLLTAIAPAIVLRRKLRGRQPQRGKCPKCGYDLRATPERCPECGLAVRPAASTNT
jgi:hypothetical protein